MATIGMKKIPSIDGTQEKYGFTNKIKDNIKNSSIYQRISAGLTFGISLASELYWLHEFNKVKDAYYGPTEDGSVYISPSIKSVDLLPIPKVEPLGPREPRSLVSSEVTGIDAEIYKIASNPLFAAGFMIGTVGLVTLGAYWLGGKILPKKEKVEEVKPDISDILDKIEQPDISDIIDVPAGRLEMEVDA